MFKLPPVGSLQRCEFAAADACLSPDEAAGPAVWERLKEEGSALLRRGDATAAALRYQEAFAVARSRVGLMQSFLNGLHARSASPLRALAGEADLLRVLAAAAFPQNPLFEARRRPMLWAALAPPPEYAACQRTVRVAGGSRQLSFDASRGGSVPTLLGRPAGWLLPNQNAAVCAANAAAAFLQAGDPERALEAGLQAAAACPEYAKAHHRVVRALQAGARGDLRGEAPAEMVAAQLETLRAMRAEAAAEDGAEENLGQLDDLIAQLEADALALSAGGPGMEEDGSIAKRELVASMLDVAAAVESTARLLPSVDIALFGAGQIGYEQLRARQAWRLQRTLERERVAAVELRFSLVPFKVSGLDTDGRGSWLMMALVAGASPFAAVCRVTTRASRAAAKSCFFL